MEEGEDRLQLLHRWLACDEAAGDQLWSGPGGLFEEYRKKGKEWGLRHVYKLRRCGVRIDHEQYLAFKEYEMESLAADQLSDIHDRLKSQEANPEEEERKSSKKGKKPADFQTWDDFAAFLEVSLQGLKDLIKDHLGINQRLIMSLDEPLPGRGEEAEGEERTLGETVASMEESPEATVMAADRRRIADNLLRNFREHLERRRPPAPALLCHFDRLVEAHKAGRDDIPLEEVAEDVIEFLEASEQDTGEPRKQHRAIRDYCRSKGVDNTTYDAYNRRLRHEWKVFREGPGKAFYQRYEEA